MEKRDQIKEQVIFELNGMEPGKYITIAFGTDDFRLTSVQAILTSEYLEVIDKEDWSDYIEIDYNDIPYDGSNMNDDSDELHISLKPNVERNDEISENDITPKTDKSEDEKQA